MNNTYEGEKSKKNKQKQNKKLQISRQKNAVFLEGGIKMSKKKKKKKEKTEKKT